MARGAIIPAKDGGHRIWYEAGGISLDATFSAAGTYVEGGVKKNPQAVPAHARGLRGGGSDRKKYRPTLPGSIIHGWLKRLGIVPKGECNCNKIIRAMDALGPDLCWDIRNQIAKWMMDEARKRDIPVNWWLCVKIVERAIVTSRKRLKAASIIV